MPNIIKGILFDKDGTLIPFNKTWLDAYIKAAKFLSESVCRPDLERQLLLGGGYIPETQSWVSDSLLASGSNAQIMAFWGEQIGGSLSPAQISGIGEIFSAAAKNNTPVLDDMTGFLIQLKKRGLVLGLATMDDEKSAYSTLKKLEIQHLFDFICGADSGYGVKPEPGMVDAFSASCGISNAQVIMVGDSPKDLNMGRNAKVALTIGVLTGAHNHAELQPHADYVYSDISGLSALLDQMGMTL